MKQFSIKEPEEIKFGKTMLPADLETLRMYIICAMKDKGTIKASGTHTIIKFLDDLDAVFASSSTLVSQSDLSPSGATTVTSCARVIMYNLGKLARIVYEGDDFAYHAARIQTELLTKADKTGQITDTNSQVGKYSALWFVVGADMKELFGQADATKYQYTDYMLAGMWVTLNYVLFLWTGHLISYADLIRKTGKFSKNGDIHEGEFKPVVSSDPTTFGSLLTAVENGVTDYFGISQTKVASDTLKGITVATWEGLDAIWQRLLSQTRWEWRFGRFVEVQPVFFIWNPSDDEDGNTAAEFVTNDETVELFVSKTKTDWIYLNRRINELCADIKKHWFANKSYASLKEKIKFISFMELPPIGEGTGGLLMHQVTSFDPTTDATYDHIDLKFDVDDADLGFDTLAIRRSENQINVFEVLGDVPLNDYLFMFGINCRILYNGSDNAITAVKPIVPRGMLAFAYGKKEDKDYYIDRTPLECIGDTLHDSALVGTAEQAAEIIGGSVYTYVTGIEAVTPWTWIKPTKEDDIRIVSATNKKSYYYEQRALDPYKKIKHTVYDINNLDIENIALLMRKEFWNMGGSIDSKVQPIPVSAMPAAISEKIEEEKKKDELAVSAMPVAQAAKELKVAEADLKKAKEEMKQSKVSENGSK